MKISKTLFRALYSEFEDKYDFKCIASCTCSLDVMPEHYESVYGADNCNYTLTFECKYPNGDMSKEPYDKQYYLRISEENEDER